MDLKLMSGLLLALAMPSAFGQTPPQPPVSRIIEYDPRPNKCDGGTCKYEGEVTDIQSIGLNWTGKWHDGTNYTIRDVDISVDDTSHQMTIRESGGGGGSPLQIWQGDYRERNGLYRMSGKIIQESGKPPPVAFTINASLYLPD